MPPARFVRLTPEEDARLRAIEQDPLLKPKVRLRAQVLRLSGRGEGVGSIAAYTGRSEASVLRDLDRWEERSFGGLADGTAPGNPPRITGEVRAFMEEKLWEERTSGTPRSWPRRWATVGSAPATCPPAHRTPRRSARPRATLRG